MKRIGRIPLLLLAFGSLALGACAEGNYLYRPVQQGTATVSGLPAARYAIPAERPQGEVLVVSSGVTEIKPNNAAMRVLFVRVVISNNSDDAGWHLDTRKQLAVFEGRAPVAATFANTFGQPLPVVDIARGEKRTIDFYYPLPEGTESSSDIPQFDLTWNVETGTRPIAERTSFDRFRVERVYATPYYGSYGFSPYYSRWGWYDPYWGPYYGIYGYGGHSGWGYGGGYYRGYGGGGYYGGGGIGGGGRPAYSRPSVQRR